ncbi:uncharacterized protein DS421_19g661720 [Arachis hypogaea]|uniref:Uncharacterized protein n=1 Tax=Arachis hypogaea TaxID=3818 RepID=A0A6B9VEC6_ARAHY|nr:uncharacterized protein DS421_19g661720 [Arachis hypogaea]
MQFKHITISSQILRIMKINNIQNLKCTGTLYVYNNNNNKTCGIMFSLIFTSMLEFIVPMLNLYTMYSILV